MAQGMIVRRGGKSDGGVTPKYVIYGVSIDLTNPDPASAVTYTDNAVGMTPGAA